jgi:hypothetical protein
MDGWILMMFESSARRKGSALPWQWEHPALLWQTEEPCPPNPSGPSGPTYICADVYCTMALSDACTRRPQFWVDGWDGPQNHGHVPWRDRRVARGLGASRMPFNG